MQISPMPPTVPFPGEGSAASAARLQDAMASLRTAPARLWLIFSAAVALAAADARLADVVHTRIKVQVVDRRARALSHEGDARRAPQKALTLARDAVRPANRCLLVRAGAHPGPAGGAL